MAKPDQLTVAMQNEVIKTSEERLGESLKPDLIAKIRRARSYMGLEMMIDTVRTIELNELKNYIDRLAE